MPSSVTDRLSLTYDVRVVNLDTRLTHTRVPVASRDVQPFMREGTP